MGKYHQFFENEQATSVPRLVVKFADYLKPKREATDIAIMEKMLV